MFLRIDAKNVAACFFSLVFGITGSLGLDAEKGFFPNQAADWLPAFLAFSFCAILIRKKPWLACVAMVFLAVELTLISLATGHLSPGFALAFLVTGAAFLRNARDRKAP